MHYSLQYRNYRTGRNLTRTFPKIVLKYVLQNLPILQIFGVVLFSVFSVVNGFTEIKKAPKWEKYIEQSQTASTGPEFKLNWTLRNRSHPKF